MDNPRLYSILLKLHQHLSDNDRERLDLYLKNDVPKPVGDDSTLGETLKLIQSLFDQDEIEEKDFTLLINGFKQIRCFDAVKLLEEHQRRMLSRVLNQSSQSLALIMPSHIQEFIDNHEYEYPYVTVNLDENKLVDYHNVKKNDIIDGENKTINKDKRKRSSSRNPCFCVRLLKNKWFVLASILFILTLVILIVVLIEGNDLINKLKNNVQIKESFISERENQTNQTVKQLKNELSEKNAKIEQLNKKLEECNKERNITLIIAGQKFGDDSGRDSDDSLLKNFTTSHYLSGFVFSDIDAFYACQFIYRTANDNERRIKSSVYGEYGRKLNRTYEYHLNDDERIKEVQIQLVDKEFLRHDNSSLTIKIITGLKFITTKGESFPPGIDLTGDGIQSESFPGYTLGYVTGRSALTVDQLQFFWYRTEPY